MKYMTTVCLLLIACTLCCANAQVGVLPTSLTQPKDDIQQAGSDTAAGGGTHSTGVKQLAGDELPAPILTSGSRSAVNSSYSLGLADGGKQEVSAALGSHEEGGSVVGQDAGETGRDNSQEVSAGAVFVLTVIMAAASGLGALPFFFTGTLSARWGALASAMACGVMLAASFDLVHEGEPYGAGMVILGVMIGTLFIKASQQWLDQFEDVKFQSLRGASARKTLLMVGIMTAHALGEGSGVGVSFCGRRGWSQGLLVTLAIGLHNVPEGLAVATVLVAQGISPWHALCWTLVTSLPQPLLALPSFLFVDAFSAMLPLALGFAAGCMVWIVFAELLPDALANAPHAQVATTATMSAAALEGMRMVLYFLEQHSDQQLPLWDSALRQAFYMLLLCMSPGIIAGGAAAMADLSSAARMGAAAGFLAWVGAQSVVSGVVAGGLMGPALGALPGGLLAWQAWQYMHRRKRRKVLVDMKGMGDVESQAVSSIHADSTHDGSLRAVHYDASPHLNGYRTPGSGSPALRRQQTVYDGPKPAGLPVLQKVKAESREAQQSLALMSTGLLMVLGMVEGIRMAGAPMSPQLAPSATLSGISRLCIMATAAGLLARIGASSCTKALLMVLSMCVVVPASSVFVLSVRVNESVVLGWVQSSVAGALITIGLLIVLPAARVLHKRVALTCSALAIASALFVCSVVAAVSLN